MPERKNFLIFAISLGVFGIIFGTITIWNSISEFATP
jgi:hypothetical protein